MRRALRAAQRRPFVGTSAIALILLSGFAMAYRGGGGIRSIFLDQVGSPLPSPSGEGGGGGGDGLPVWLPAAWEPNVVYESDLCFVMVTALDTLPESGTNEYDEGEFGPGPDDGEWHIVDFGSPSGYTSGGAVSGFTPARHISDDISGSAVALDFLGTGCAFEGRQDPAASPAGQGPDGGNGPPSPRLIFSQIPGAQSGYTKVFVRVEMVLESAAMFGGEDYQFISGGIKLFRILGDNCANNPQGIIIDHLNNVVQSAGCGQSEPGCTVHVSNVWGQWPSHAGDVVSSADPCFDGTADEGWSDKIGTTIVYFTCLDTDPDHDGDPADGDMATLSHGFDEPEGIMMYFEASELTGNDAGFIRAVMNDNTWGGNGTRLRPFSKWLTNIKVWHGEGTGVSCTVPPIAPWT